FMSLAEPVYDQGVAVIIRDGVPAAEKYIMKFLWTQRWFNRAGRSSHYGLTTFRVEPDPSDKISGSLAPTPENGFIEVSIELVAADLEEAKREAWRHWKEQL